MESKLGGVRVKGYMPKSHYGSGTALPESHGHLDSFDKSICSNNGSIKEVLNYCSGYNTETQLTASTVKYG